jgi:hypothetical protein
MTWGFLSQGQARCPIKVAGLVGWTIVAAVLVLAWFL